MGVKASVERYHDGLHERWDDFVMNRSCNGTFLQTRNFLDYHPEGRFQDASLVIWNGTSDILAVVPAAVVEDTGGPLLSSHPGSTFGGPVLNAQFYDIRHVEAALVVIEEYCSDCGFAGIRLKPSSQVFSRASNALLEYLLFQRGWSASAEISFVIDLAAYGSDTLARLSSSKRRDFRKAVESGLEFRKLELDDEVGDFYRVLEGNLAKFGARPVHALNELLDFKNNRLSNCVSFFGVYAGDDLAAASMVFVFGRDVFHTQYLAADQGMLAVFPNNYLDVSMIDLARDEGFRWFSFGTSTEDGGRVLNRSLAEFKEGFGTTYCNNKAFEKALL